VKIHEMFLDESNRRVCCGKSIKELITAGGKKHLWDERKGNIIDTVVLHYISAVEVVPSTPFCEEAILKIFCDYSVSSHYLINRRGKIFQLVPEDKRAWHAGGSIMPEPDRRIGVNEFSIGIEIVATPSSGFTKLQYESLGKLCSLIEKRYCKEFTYTGHEHIAGQRAVKLGLRKDVKIDPGPLFDWELFKLMLDKYRMDKALENIGRLPSKTPAPGLRQARRASSVQDRPDVTKT